MPVDFDRRLLHLHIPKTGGSTISKILKIDDKEHYYHDRPIRELTPDTTPQHMTAMQLKSLFGDVLFYRLFKFAFVRNPWDRFVSEYFWRKENLKMMQDGSPCLIFGEKEMESLHSFSKCLDIPEEKRIICGIGFDRHLETQSSFIHNPDNGRLLVDFIGRYERFEEDVKIVCSTLDVDIKDIPVIRASKRDKDYRKYYDTETKKKIAEFYAEDVERGQYLF